MKTSFVLGAVTVFGLAAGGAVAGTLDDVKARGTLNCGVSTGLVGFAAPDAAGVWKGFDVDMCRAVAAAVLNDANAVDEQLWRVHVMNQLVHQRVVAAPLDVRLGALDRITDRDLGHKIAEHGPPAEFRIG